MATGFAALRHDRIYAAFLKGECFFYGRCGTE